MSEVAVAEEVTPILFDHCKTVYQAMFDRANIVYPDGGEEDPESEDHMLVYEGHLTRLFTELRLSVPYYSSVMQSLKRMGCVRQLRRGGGNAASQWELITEPTEELFRTKEGRPQGHSKIENLEQRVNDMNGRILRLEQMVGLVS